MPAPLTSPNQSGDSADALSPHAQMLARDREFRPVSIRPAMGHTVNEHGGRMVARGVGAGPAGSWLGALLLVCAVALLAACRHSTATNKGGNPRAIESLGQSLKAGRIAGLSLSETNQGRASRQYTLTNETCVLRVEVLADLDQEAATMLRQEGIMGLQALYASALSPYPGDISHRQVAQEKYRPRFISREVNETSYQFFLLFANARLGFGVTSEDSVQFKALLGWLYCVHDRSFYKVRYFAPLSTTDPEMEQFFLALGCPQAIN